MATPPPPETAAGCGSAGVDLLGGRGLIYAVQVVVEIVDGVEDDDHAPDAAGEGEGADDRSEPGHGLRGGPATPDAADVDQPEHETDQAEDDGDEAGQWDECEHDADQTDHECGDGETVLRLGRWHGLVAVDTGRVRLRVRGRDGSRHARA